MIAKKYKLRLQSGFTLLELIVVVAVLGLISTLATDFMVNETAQKRYEANKDRLEKIRYAIIGDSSKSLNGSPDLTGFVHDMGRLPNNFSELVTEPTDCDLDTAGNQACSMSFNANLGRPIGWGGPYIASEVADYDGWGFSWQGNIAAGTVESYGLDGLDDTATPNDDPYEDDTSTEINDADYLIQLSEDHASGLGVNGISVAFNSAILGCSDPLYTDQTDCLNNGGTWGNLAVCASLVTVENGNEVEVPSQVGSSPSDDVSLPVIAGASHIYRFYLKNGSDIEAIKFPYGQQLFRIKRCDDQSVVLKTKKITFAPRRTVPAVTFL